ncbi:hypothetical protein CFT61_02025 [Segatella copri]|uniref:Uncharacterized protein n=1 Tax=Segatella copri TaxID=165179 RepID=A0AA91TMK4_9BACT|nr:hypothetical protein [Segatella copri]OXL45520.1 hypothetical protein CFT61_02025 [Segatella copri]
MNILISQEKMGDNIKKVANLFAISDFCSIYYCNNDKESQPFRRRRLALLVFIWEDDSHNPLNFSVLCHFLSDFLAVSNLSS